MTNLKYRYNYNKANAWPCPPNLSNRIRNTLFSISHVSITHKMCRLIIDIIGTSETPRHMIKPTQ